MDHLWTPWRYAYITTAEKAVRAGVPEALASWPGDLGCVFCNLIAAIDHAIANGIAIRNRRRQQQVVSSIRFCFHGLCFVSSFFLVDLGFFDAALTYTRFPARILSFLIGAVITARVECIVRRCKTRSEEEGSRYR